MKGFAIFMAVAVGVYLMISLLVAVIGLANAHSNYNTACSKYPQSRAGYLFPSYKLGCWLGEDI